MVKISNLQVNYITDLMRYLDLSLKFKQQIFRDHSTDDLMLSTAPKPIKRVDIRLYFGITVNSMTNYLNYRGYC